MTPADESTASRERLVVELRSALLARRSELRGQIERLEGDLRELREEWEPELVERGQEETIARTLTRLDDREGEELEAIELALQRIANGAYGVCMRCGLPIAAPRLRALPWAATCVECAPS